MVAASVAAASARPRPRLRATARRRRRLHELGIDPIGRGAARGVEQVDQLGAHEHVLLERHRPLLRDDHVGVAAHRLQPVAELLGVRHRRAERDHAHALREVDDDLLPDGAAEAVGEVVHLVHDDVGEVGEQVRVGVEHVAQHLGRHDDDARAGVDVGVAGEQADLRRPVLGDELLELLVAERLHRRGVEHLRARLAHGQEDRELGDDRLARAGRRGDEHAAALLECGAGRELEGVEVELQPARNASRSGARLPARMPRTARPARGCSRSPARRRAPRASAASRRFMRRSCSHAMP